VQDEVLGERELEHEAAAVPVLRDVADTVVEEGVRALAGELFSRDDDAAGFRLLEAGDRIDQLRLAVAVDARERDDLTGVHVERHPAHRFEAAVVADV